MTLATYPAYPQPILQHPTTGDRWYLGLTNGGILRPEGKTRDAATDLPRVTLVTTDRTAAFRFALGPTDPPSLTLQPWPAAFGGRDWLSVWAPNGREFQLQIANSSGVITVSKLGTEWPRQNSPIIPDPTGAPWAIQVSDGALLQATQDWSLTTRQSFRLLSQDATTAWEVQIDANGIFSVVELARVERSIYLRANTSTNVYQVVVDDTSGMPILDLVGPVSQPPTSPWPTILAMNWSPPTLCHLTVNDTDPANPLLQLSSAPTTVPAVQPPQGVQDAAIYLRSPTSGIRYMLTVQDTDASPATHANPVLQVQADDLAPGNPLTFAQSFDTEIVAPGPVRYQIEVDQNGILYTDSITDLINQRDEWPLVISQHMNYLYIADSRFPPPIPAVPRRWGQRRRVPKRP